MNIEKVDGSELRFKNPGSLLLVVIGFIFWGIGFIDLLGHTSAEPDIFGLYSFPFFVFILLYGATIILWLALFLNTNFLSQVSDWIGNIQQHTWLTLTLFVGLGVALWVIFEWDRWSRMPGLQFAAFGLVLLAGAILLFANWNENSKQQWWRKLIIYPLIALLVVEVVIQMISFLGILPGVHSIGGNFTPYERIYYNVEGFQNGYANRYGWTFPNDNLVDGNKRVLIVGGSNVQALQVEQEQQVTALLTEMVNQKPAEDVLIEFVSIGLPGFGLSPFLFDEVIEPPNLLNYNELIVFFHLGDDFQSPSLSDNAIMYVVSDDGTIDVHPDYGRLRHDLTHYYLHGFRAFQPVETIRNNYITFRAIKGLVNSWIGDSVATMESVNENSLIFPRIKGIVTKNYSLTEPGHAGIKATEMEIIPGGNNFMFLPSREADIQEALLIADGMLKTAQEIASANDILIRLVTIPVFPEEFYQTFRDSNWESQVGEYDLFLPERALVEIAEKYNIPILPMGNYMLENQLTTDEIKALYFSDGLGHLSSQGHEYFADAIYSCFFSDVEMKPCSK